MGIEYCGFCGKYVDEDKHCDIYCDVCGQVVCEGCQDITDLDESHPDCPPSGEPLMRCPDCVGKGAC